MGQFIHCPIFYFRSGKTQVKRDERSELKLVCIVLCTRPLSDKIYPFIVNTSSYIHTKLTSW